MSSNQFSVDEWNTTECRLTIVVLDLSSSTTFPVSAEFVIDPATGSASQSCTVLDYAKDYIIALAPALTKGRLVVVACASRCEVGLATLFLPDSSPDSNDSVRASSPIDCHFDCCLG